MITVNTRPFEWQEGLTVKKLLELKKYTYPKIIVRINGQLIPPEQYGTAVIRDGDIVSALHLMAGG